MKEKAFFVFHPRRVDDLLPKYENGKWREVQIVGTVMLSKLDFENFATDLLADRQFIEDNAILCQRPNDCLLVTTRAHTDELLIIPWKGCYVRFAALRQRIRLL